MEQQELRCTEMKTNLSINQQQQQQKEDVKTNRRDSASAGVKVQKWIGRDLWK